MSRKSMIAFLIGAVSLLVLTGIIAAQADGEPLTAFSSTLFVGSGDCGNCHTGLSDSASQDVSFDTNWRASIMANSAKDPLWLAKVESEIERTPGLQAAIEDKCGTCHMPMAHTEATSEGTSTAISGDGFLNTANDLHEAAMG